MNRETAMMVIRAEYAEHGEMTSAAMRAYAESRISYDIFMRARRAGMQMHQEEQEQ